MTTHNCQNSTLKLKRETVLYYLRHIGHIRLMLKFLITKEETPSCKSCTVSLTVKHILAECHKYNEDCFKFNIPDNLDTSLKPNSSTTI